MTQRGNYKEARSLIKSAVKLKADDSILWSHYARVEDKLNNFTHARALFRRACRVNPRDWYVGVSDACVSCTCGADVS